MHRANRPRQRAHIARAAVVALLGLAPLAGTVVPGTAFAADTSTGCYTVPGNLVKDCGFEIPNLGTSYNYQLYGSGYPASSFGDSTQPWIVSAGNVDVDANGPAAHSGQQDIDLSGTMPGTIDQSIPTDAAHTYAISFYLAGNTCGTEPKTLSVSFGTTTNPYTFDATSTSYANMGWVNETFTAAGAAGTGTTHLTFTSTTAGGCGPELDDVVVTDLGLTSSLGNNGGTATPELGSGELLATGVLPLLAVALYRRRKSRRTPDDTAA